MPANHTLSALTEPQLARLGDDIAFAVRPGDTIALEGDLGAGKTTLARALIRTLMANDGEEIPSPTFTLVQTYMTPRMEVAHFDLYRIGLPAEMDELGLDEALRRGIAIVEWPDRAGGRLPENRLHIRLEDEPPSKPGEPSPARHVSMSGLGPWAPRLDRLIAIREFLNRAGAAGPDTRLHYLQGDASVRRYARIAPKAGGSKLLMDWPRQPDGPPIRGGLPYSRIAHLAEDVRPFVAIAAELRKAGLSAPEIYAHDYARGLLLLEDFGDSVFGAALAQGASQVELWRGAVDVLVALRAQTPPNAMTLDDGAEVPLPAMDLTSLGIETELLPDWYWPALHGMAPSAEARAEFSALWKAIFDKLLEQPKGWVLRDFHSPNLIWLPERHGPRRVGVIDFQDALSGPRAYDLVSLLQDARLDVPATLEADLFNYYCARAAVQDPAFDRTPFEFSYAALGAQRNTKILGIFARLAKRDGKPAYLRHIPRIWGYLEHDLAHPALKELRGWYDRHLPPDLRSRTLKGS